MADLRDFTGKNAEFTGDYTGITSGTTAERPSNPVVGMIRHNTTIEVLEQYTTNGWVPIAAPPTASGASPNEVNEQDATQQFVINGSNFSTSVTVKAIGQDGSQVTPSSVIRNSSSQITVTFTAPNTLTNDQEPWAIQVSNSTGLSFSLEEAVYVNANPVWTTGTDIGDYWENTSNTYTFNATDPEGGSITYSIADAGSLVSTSINSTTGVLTFTAPSVSANTDYNFTIRATDANGLFTDKQFLMTSLVNDGPVWNQGPGTTYTTNTMTAFSNSFTAYDPQGHGVSISLVSGSLPAGLSINSSGTITGTVDWSTLSGAWSTTYNFTLRATDTLLGDFTDRAFAVTVNNEYYYRQVYSYGYIAGGYVGSTVHRAAHRLQISNNGYTPLGDRLDRNAGYVSGGWSDNKMWCYATGGGLGAYSDYSGMNMFTETSTDNGNHGTSKDDAGTMSNHGGRVGTPANYTIGGNNSTNIKHTFSNNSISTVAGGSSNNYGNAWESDTYGYDAYFGQKFYFGNETWSGGVTPGGSNQAHSKTLSSKRGFALVENGGNNTSSYHRHNFSNDSIQNNWVSKPVGPCGETNYAEGQDWGYALGACSPQACQNGWYWRQNFTSASGQNLGNADRSMSSGDGGSRIA
jgi:hypothetical protein